MEAANVISLNLAEHRLVALANQPLDIFSFFVVDTRLLKEDCSPKKLHHERSAVSGFPQSSTDFERGLDLPDALIGYSKGVCLFSTSGTGNPCTIAEGLSAASSLPSPA